MEEAIETLCASKMRSPRGRTIAKAPPRGLDLHFLDGLLQLFGVVDRSDIDAREAAKRISVKRGNAGLEMDRPNPILPGLLDLEGHQKALALGIVCLGRQPRGCGALRRRPAGFAGEPATQCEQSIHEAAGR